ncbi:MAG: C10 family peptidase, partial [Duncaniella sp.]|nr:C10 family peptidase [Duncaniella sp.]
MGSSVSARTLSPSEALSRALSTTTESGRAHRAPVQKTPVMTVGEASAPALYVFDQGNEGYLVVSADDVAAPILGYSTTGTFDPNNIPENMRWWLGQYKLEIEAAAKDSAQSYSRTAEDTRQPIEPLIKTTWNQGEPYNCEAPNYLDGEQCVTGCVATAMAQVMNYHK